MPFCPPGKIHQLIVQFASRIPTKRELTAGEKRTLEGLLRELSNEHFQLSELSPARDPSSLFQISCQHTVGASILTLPSFIFSRDSFSFFYPTRLMNNPIDHYETMFARELNGRISGWTNRVLDAVDSRCQRAGKIYLMVLGPFTPAEKERIFERISCPDMAEVGEYSFTFTYYRTVDANIYDFLTNAHFMVPDLRNNFYVQIKVDINNRILSNLGMEPPDIQRVWDFADQNIERHLQSILNIVEQGDTHV